MGVLWASLAWAAPCKDPQALYNAARRASTADKIWRAEARLLEGGRLCDAPAPQIGATPPRIYPEVRLPAQPISAGAGPWLLMGLSAALVGGVLYYDAAADADREALGEANARGDQRAYDQARGALLGKQMTARGLAAGAGGAALVALLWWAWGGEADPAQPSPTFNAASGLGVGGVF